MVLYESTLAQVDKMLTKSEGRMGLVPWLRMLKKSGIIPEMNEVAAYDFAHKMQADFPSFRDADEITILDAAAIVVHNSVRPIFKSDSVEAAKEDLGAKRTKEALQLLSKTLTGVSGPLYRGQGWSPGLVKATGVTVPKVGNKFKISFTLSTSWTLSEGMAKRFAAEDKSEFANAQWNRKGAYGVVLKINPAQKNMLFYVSSPEVQAILKKWLREKEVLVAAKASLACEIVAVVKRPGF